MLSSNTSAVSGDATYIEDVFSTYLWDGNATARNIVNGIDLATKGGMVWAKYRNVTASNRLYDTARGATKQIFSDLTNAEQTAAQSLTSFNTDGFSLGTGQPNENTATVVGWTFRKQPKFFDVVTYTGNGTATNNISHNLGSVPGFIVVKCTSAAGYRWVCAASDNSGNYLYLTLNTTFASDASTVKSNIATSTTFNPGYMGVYFDGGANVSGETYVAYLFASNAGGFGLTGTDNVISCGSYNGNTGVINPVTLGYEPQWVMVKCSNTTDGYGWGMIDNMRGFTVPGSPAAGLVANTSGAEFGGNYLSPTATGFTANATAWNETGKTYIYIAIRRGPMKVPTDGTKVYQTSSRSSTAPAWTSNFPADWFFQRTTGSDNWAVLSRLTGTNQLRFNTTDAATEATEFKFDRMDGVNGSLYNASNDRGWMMKRAPSFFDEVCYTGTGANQNLSHNLGVVPELMIAKSRSFSAAYTDWIVYTSKNGSNKIGFLDLDAAFQATPTNVWPSDPTSSVFTVGASPTVNSSGNTYVAYLFSTCAGVSKVGNYTGTGTTKQVDCGFAAGARFVLIKRTDSTGDWYVWDTARGIVSGNDPYLLLNSTAAETTTTDYIDTYSAGFELSSTAPAALNASGGSYIFLAIA